MNDVMKDLTSVAMAIVGVAILGVLFVKGGQNTPAVINSAAGGFANVLGVAMGGNPSSASM